MKKKTFSNKVNLDEEILLSRKTPAKPINLKLGMEPVFADVFGRQTKAQASSAEVEYVLETDGKYRIDNFDTALPFSSFLPGIAGSDGVPLWCMYVNRGQCVVSFGLANKDNAIAEFLPATWAYQLVGTQGFRTFCKINGNFYEPFQNNLSSTEKTCKRSMWIESDRLYIREVNHTFGLCFDVEYFSPVNKPIGSLFREVKISNISNKPIDLSGLDGLALIIPAGLTDNGLKHMRHLSEAYAVVKLVDENVPFYSAKVMAHDEAEVQKVTQGNFYAAWTVKNKKLIPVQPVVDPHVVFGAGQSLTKPSKFISSGFPNPSDQVWENRLPCALAPFETTLPPNKSFSLIAAVGHAPDAISLKSFLNYFSTVGDIENVAAESRQVTKFIVAPAMTVSNNPVFDAYTSQNYLDNVLRGGIPKLLPSKNNSHPLYLYSRRHGDLERDYNFFELLPHPLSSGAGNYRDICQNSRNNVWFYPDLMDHEIRMFVQLLQADGYNPLSVEGYRWSLPEDIEPLQFCPSTDSKASNKFCGIFDREFHPGELLKWANANNVSIKDRPKWLNEILSCCNCKLIASDHEGGYWVDHWTYITDSLEAFASVYPDRVSDMLTGRADIGWFDDGAYVRSRRNKYIERPSGALQINAVTDTEISKTPLPPVTVLGKLCGLLAIKAVSLDYEGKGIEMEAGRPGWNDSLNGLSGLFGSSTCEVAEAARMAHWLLENLSEVPDTLFPVEVADFIDEVADDVTSNDYCWDFSSNIREKFRGRIKNKISGKTRNISGTQLYRLLKGVELRMMTGVSASVDRDTSLINTYYRGIPVEPKTQTNPDDSIRMDQATGSPYLDIQEFMCQPLPLFLEGQVHMLRLIKDTDKARKIYNSVRNSNLFDSQLKMYKLNECLDKCPEEIGRARIFSRGWFENESIWLHMSYKYMLELLRTGLYEEFFEDAKTMLVPFMDPKVYGRSVLENSSFISSSVSPDPKARGRGFIARLSGSTAEFIHIWLILTVGQHPFTLKEGKLLFEVKPILPADWFTSEKKVVDWRNERVEIEANSFACAFLGDILVVYHNPSRKDTFGKKAVRPVRYVLDEKTVVNGSSLSKDMAEAVRQRKYRRIDIWLK